MNDNKTDDQTLVLKTFEKALMLFLNDGLQKLGEDIPGHIQNRLDLQEIKLSVIVDVQPLSVEVGMVCDGTYSKLFTANAIDAILQ